MLLGVMADTHDNLPKAAAALKLFAERRVEAILHAGDFVAPFVMRLLVRANVPLIGVFGNNDGERRGLLGVCSTVYEPPHRLELGGRAIVLAHAPSELEGRAVVGADLLVHGHTHRAEVRAGEPLLVNPGEAGGWLSGRCTVALVDLESMRTEIVDLGLQETVQI